jgi:uncharacterized repeat protein (TIGR03803 family)
MNFARGAFRQGVLLASVGGLAAAFLAPAAFTPARAGAETLYNFNGKSGSQPDSRLIFDANGALYGTAFYGGASQTNTVSGYGVVFRLTPPASGTGRWTETVLHSFMGGLSGGRYPMGDLVMDAQGALYGVVEMGGPHGGGYAYKLTPPASGTGAWTQTVLHGFGASSDGNNPVGGLVFDTHGALYGTASYGGAGGYGIVYKLTPPVSGAGAWKETILYSFKGQPDGSYPFGSLLIDASGALYGVTLWGGDTVTASNYGTVYKLTPSGTGTWTETVLHSFKGATVLDGAWPHGGLIFDKSGALYGVTSSGGVPMYNNGTIYKLMPPAIAGGQWTEAILHKFTVTLNDPVGNLVLDPQGNLYGVTQNGGTTTGAQGAAFQLSPPASGSGGWPFKVIHNFASCSNAIGCMPQTGLTIDASGALYGTTDTGGPNGLIGGAVFRLVCNQWSGTGANRTCVSW